MKQKYTWFDFFDDMFGGLAFLVMMGCALLFGGAAVFLLLIYPFWYGFVHNEWHGAIIVGWIYFGLIVAWTVGHYMNKREKAHRKSIDPIISHEDEDLP